MTLPDVETLQVAGLAVVSLALVGLIYKLSVSFTHSIDKLNGTLTNHFVALLKLLTEMKNEIVEHRKTERGRR